MASEWPYANWKKHLGDKITNPIHELDCSFWESLTGVMYLFPFPQLLCNLVANGPLITHLPPGTQETSPAQLH